MVGTTSVALRAVAIARPTYQHLGNGPSDSKTLTELANQLRHEYGAYVTTLEQRFLASPTSSRAALSKHLAGSDDTLLLVISGHVARFARRGGDLWALALPGSIPGRPSSMLPLHAITDAATAAAQGRALMICLDVAALPGPAASELCSAADLASVLAGGQAPTPDIMVTFDRSGSRAQAIGTHALERTLAALACDGESAPLDVIAVQAAKFARDLGAEVHALPGFQGARFTPLRRGPALPRYVRDDLFAADPGSRMDAALELATLADSGHPDAPRELGYLASRDRAADVRAYADVLIRRGLQPSLEMLRATGRIPDAVFNAAKGDRFLPELVAGPAGPVPIGTDAPDSEPADRPRHFVELAPFRLGRSPVTDRQYLAFLIATGGPCPDHWAAAANLWDGADHPVVMISYHDARRYCTWLTARLQEAGRLTTHEQITLPSEAQWEAAAGNGRGDRHPWGPEPDPTRCNIRATGIGRPSPVGTFSPFGDSTAGITDLIGNVWEWTSSAWGDSYRQPTHRYPYDPDDGREDQHAPGVRRVIRGGAFYYATDCANNHTRNRIPPDTRHPGGGFRVAATTTRAAKA